MIAMELPENYLSLPYYRSHDMDESQFREQFSREQLLCRINQSILQQQNQPMDLMERGQNVDKQASICHGCGHLGHSRPSCPYKDYPGWIARGKRNHPLDVDHHGVETSNEVCHGCGIGGHSRPQCPYKDIPGYFPYGHRRIPLDIFRHTMSSNLNQGSNVNQVGSNGGAETCHGCGYAGHSRPQCPYKDIVGWQSRGQRRSPLELNQVSNFMNMSSSSYPGSLLSSSSNSMSSTHHMTGNMMMNQLSNQLTNQLISNSSLSSTMSYVNVDVSQPYTDNESVTPTQPYSLDSQSVSNTTPKESANHNQVDHQDVSQQTNKYENVVIPTFPAVIQSTLQSATVDTNSTSPSLNVNIILDPAKIVNTISMAALNRICALGDVALNRRSTNIHMKSSSSLNFFVRLQVYLVDLNVSFVDDFYLSDARELAASSSTSSNDDEGIMLGYYAICQYNLLSYYHDMFIKQRLTVSSSLPSGSNDMMMMMNGKQRIASPTPVVPGSPNSTDSGKHGAIGSSSSSTPAVTKSPSTSSSISALQYLNDDHFAMLPSSSGQGSSLLSSSQPISHNASFNMYHANHRTTSSSSYPSSSDRPLSSSPQWYDMNTLNLDLGQANGRHNGNQQSKSPNQQDHNGSKYNVLW